MNDKDKKEYRKKQYEKNKEWYKNYYSLPENKERQKLNVQSFHLKNNYGITLEDYTEMLNKQNGLCAICGKEETATYRGKIKFLSVDHDHITGKIRGLLCSSCNHTLGWIEKNLDILNNFYIYLEQHS